MAKDAYSDTFSISVSSLQGMSTVVISGEVDTASVSLLAKALNEAVHTSNSHVILDVHDLTFIDSAGMQTLLSTKNQLSQQGRDLAIVGCHGIFHRLVTVGALEDRFPMYPTISDALTSLEERA